MKLLFGFLFIGLTLNGVLTLPARNNPQDDAEVISLPRQRNVESSSAADPDFNDFKGVIDTGSGYPFLQPIPTSFNLGFFDSFEDIFRRLRSRLWPVIRDDGIGGTAGDDSSDDSGSGFSFGLRPLIPLKPENGNTTSTVKVVDGHKVEINETVYGNANNVFKVRVVAVRPLESGEDVDEGVTNNQGEEKPVATYGPSTSAPALHGEFDDEEDDADRREPLEKQSKDNEIRDIDALQSATTPATTKTTTATTKIASSPAIDSIAESTDIRQNIMANMDEHQQKQQEENEEEEESHLAQDATTMQYNEETEELDDSHNHNEPQEQQQQQHYEQELEQEQEQEHEHEDDESLTAIENFDDEDDNADEEPEQQQQAALQHKEREELESSDDDDDGEEHQTPPTMSATFNDEWSSLDQDQAEDAANDLDNNIDIYEKFVPIDLSNDIAVNDAAAANPEFPINPDAEFIEFPTEVYAMVPKFEKLSMGPMPTTEMK